MFANNSLMKFGGIIKHCGQKRAHSATFHDTTTTITTITTVTTVNNNTTDIKLMLHTAMFMLCYHFMLPLFFTASPFFFLLIFFRKSMFMCWNAIRTFEIACQVRSMLRHVFGLVWFWFWFGFGLVAEHAMPPISHLLATALATF